MEYERLAYMILYLLKDQIQSVRRHLFTLVNDIHISAGYRQNGIFNVGNWLIFNI